ncbi:MAG: hypothetical protein AAB267_03560 [Candidatus Desantisbacteria bacterium]
MEIGETIKKAIQEFILPELDIIKGEYKEIKLLLGAVNTRIDDVNKRLDDINVHLVDQSRRIDETNKRIDRLYEVIVRREEHNVLEMRVAKMEKEVEKIRRKAA